MEEAVDGSYTLTTLVSFSLTSEPLSKRKLISATMAARSGCSSSTSEWSKRSLGTEKNSNQLYSLRNCDTLSDHLNTSSSVSSTYREERVTEYATIIIHKVLSDQPLVV